MTLAIRYLDVLLGLSFRDGSFRLTISCGGETLTQDAAFYPPFCYENSCALTTNFGEHSTDLARAVVQATSSGGAPSKIRCSFDRHSQSGEWHNYPTGIRATVRIDESAITRKLVGHIHWEALRQADWWSMFFENTELAPDFGLQISLIRQIGQDDSSPSKDKTETSKPESKCRIMTLFGRPDAGGRDVSNWLRSCRDQLQGVLRESSEWTQSTVVANSSVDRLAGSIQLEDPHVLILVGHGTQEGVFVNDRESVDLSYAELSKMCRSLPSLKLVVLVACGSFSGGVELTRSGIPSVISAAAPGVDLPILNASSFLDAMLRHLRSSFSTEGSMTWATVADPGVFQLWSNQANALSFSEFRNVDYKLLRDDLLWQPVNDDLPLSRLCSRSIEPISRRPTETRTDSIIGRLRQIRDSWRERLNKRLDHDDIPPQSDLAGPRVVIFGSPGSGLTTSARQLASCLSKDRNPILIEIGTVLSNHSSIRKFLLSDDFCVGRLHRTARTKLIRDLEVDDNYSLIIDMSENGDSKRAWEFVHKFTEQPSASGLQKTPLRSEVILLCSAGMSLPNELIHYKHHRLLPLTDDQLQEFCLQFGPEDDTHTRGTAIAQSLVHLTAIADLAKHPQFLRLILASNDIIQAVGINEINEEESFGKLIGCWIRKSLTSVDYQILEKQLEVFALHTVLLPKDSQLGVALFAQEFSSYATFGSDMGAIHEGICASRLVYHEAATDSFQFVRPSLLWYFAALAIRRLRTDNDPWVLDWLNGGTEIETRKQMACGPTSFQAISDSEFASVFRI